MFLKNVGANLVAGLIGPVMAIVFTPFYIRRLGIEGYGLVGYFAVLALVFQIFAQAINVIVQKEAATAPQEAKDRESLRNLIATLEAGYGIVSVIIAAAIALAAGWVSAAWVSAEGAARSDARTSLLLGGILIGLNLMSGLYASVFVGLGKQVFLGGVSSLVQLLQACLAVAFVAFRPLPSSFLFAQLLGLVITALVYRKSVRELTGTARFGSRIVPSVLRKHLRLSVGLIATESMGTLVTQMDRIFVAAMLPLGALGAYTVAQTGGKALGYFRNPLMTAFTPRIFRMTPESPLEEMRRVVWAAQGILVFFIIVPAAVIFTAATPLLNAWLQNPEIAAAATLPLRLLTIATAIHTLSGPFYQAQLVRHSTLYSLGTNIAALVWIPMAGPWLVHRYGVSGGAGIWLIYALSTQIAMLAGFARFYYRGAGARFAADTFRYFAKAASATLLATLVCLAALPSVMSWTSGSRASLVIAVSLIGVAAGILPYVCCFGWTTPRRVAARMEADVA